MDYLRIFAEEYGLAEVVESLADRPNVQGAILTLDEWWLTAWRYEETGRGEEWERWRWTRRHWGPMPYPFIGTDMGMSALPWIPQRRPDLNWRPPDWNEFSHMAGRQEQMPPIRLIVCLRPPASGESVEVPELPRSRLPVSFEVRPLARLSTSQRARARPVVGGVSVGAGTAMYGTLGGIVEDQTGQRYGMTCAHVFPSPTSVDQPARRDDAQATAIGMSATSIALQRCPGVGPCNPYLNSPHVASVDTTLVELEAGVTSDLQILSIGPLAGVVAKNSMTQGQEVAFEGRTSGHRIAEVGGLAVFYRLQVDGHAYCFRDLFEIRWRSFFRTFLEPVVKAGDSGAWVCAETDRGPGWCGQIIGEDRHVGYASFAENNVAAWSNAGKHLRVE
ncbi:MAG: hypothetical protein OEY28_04655 [Nitrospira sp.]|nr:hypothetical protein [Nitrospira sp.]